MQTQHYPWLVSHLVDTGKIDRTDGIILQELLQDSRIPIRMIAKAANVSRPTIYDRIKKLEQIGIIDYYSTQINYNKSGLPLTAFILVGYNPTQNKNQEEVAEEISRLDYVKRVHIISGDTDFIVEVAIGHMSTLADLIMKSISSIDGVGNTESKISFKCYQNGVEVNVPENTIS